MSIVTLFGMSDVLDRVLDNEYPTLKMYTIGILGYSWKEYLFETSKSVSMATVLSCTCTTMYKLITNWIDPFGLSISTRREMIEYDLLVIRMGLKLDGVQLLSMYPNLMPILNKQYLRYVMLCYCSLYLLDPRCRIGY